MTFVVIGVIMLVIVVAMMNNGAFSQKPPLQVEQVDVDEACVAAEGDLVHSVARILFNGFDHDLMQYLNLLHERACVDQMLPSLSAVERSVLSVVWRQLAAIYGGERSTYRARAALGGLLGPVDARSGALVHSQDRAWQSPDRSNFVRWLESSSAMDRDGNFHGAVAFSRWFDAWVHDPDRNQPVDDMLRLVLGVYDILIPNWVVVESC